MISVDIIENKRYDFFDLIDKFCCSEDQTLLVLNKLKEYGIVKTVNKSNEQKNLSDITENDISFTNVGKEDCYYVFAYVGIIIISNLIIKLYPKYLKNNKNPQNELKQIIDVLGKYNNSKDDVFKLNLDLNENYSFNMLSIILYFLEDYYENGLYTNSHKIIESNGSGEILWDKTINETYALIQNNTPYYFDFKTKKTVNDDEDYFKLLHEVIITKCSKELEKVNIHDLFDLTPVNLNENDINDFGEIEYIKYKITQELNIQFNSHKQSLLKAMYLYLDHSNTYLGDINYFNVYGTNAYYYVWEEMCRCVLNNKLKIPLNKLQLPNGNFKGLYDENQDLLSIIEKPKWFLLNNSNDYDVSDADTLIPDLITFHKTDRGIEFIIFDAKYYDSDLTKKPGIGDIIKQYLYELAYKDFINLNGFIDSKNCFLLPIDGENIINKGHVELNMLHDLGLKNIQIILLPARLINQLYLDNKILNTSNLIL